MPKIKPKLTEEIVKGGEMFRPKLDDETDQQYRFLKGKNKKRYQSTKPPDTMKQPPRDARGRAVAKLSDESY